MKLLDTDIFHLKAVKSTIIIVLLCLEKENVEKDLFVDCWFWQYFVYLHYQITESANLDLVEQSLLRNKLLVAIQGKMQ